MLLLLVVFSITSVGKFTLFTALYWRLVGADDFILIGILVSAKLLFLRLIIDRFVRSDTIGSLDVDVFILVLVHL
uniref:Putative secreted peptide n=1 Tax=Anopheles braziliensis TaxID=58242 RepID=A0A2M3ZTQ1_9DIPT